MLVTNSSNNTIYGGDGTDTLINYGKNNKVNNVENANTISFTQNETKQIQIGDKYYTVTNNYTYGESNTLTWSTDENGQITFDGNDFTIAATAGQEDNIIVNGHKITLNTSDQNDTVTLASGSSHNTIDVGDGNDTITLAGGSSYNTIDGGAGTNTVNNNSNANNNIIINATNYPNGDVINFTQNETKQIQIGDKSYTVVNNTSSSNTLTWSIDDNGQITFNGDFFTITAADNQEDNIVVDGYNNIINTGDMSDTVILNGYHGYINTGDGNDTVTIASSSYNNTIDGGTGKDTLINNSGNSSNTITNFELPLNSANGTYSFDANESQQIQIGDKAYTVSNNRSSSNTLTWSTDENGQITFDGNSFTINAAAGQEDNIVVDGYNNIINTGDMDDTNSSNNTIYGGDGTDTLINYGKNNKVNNVENANTLSFTKNETKQIQIGDKSYTVTNNYTYGESNTLTWSTDENGQITFDGGDFSITAASGQEDNVIVNGSWNNVNTGDQDDTVTIASSSYNNTIDGGTGTNTVTNNSSSSNTIFNATDYPDGITLGKNETQLIQIGDKYYTVTNKASYSNTLTWSTDENGQITFDGGDFSITAASGQEDNIIVDGNYNIINTGDLNDRWYWKRYSYQQQWIHKHYNKL